MAPSFEFLMKSWVLARYLSINTKGGVSYACVACDLDLPSSIVRQLANQSIPSSGDSLARGICSCSLIHSIQDNCPLGTSSKITWSSASSVGRFDCTHALQRPGRLALSLFLSLFSSFLDIYITNPVAFVILASYYESLEVKF